MKPGKPPPGPRSIPPPTQLDTMLALQRERRHMLVCVALGHVPSTFNSPPLPRGGKRLQRPLVILVGCSRCGYFFGHESPSHG